MDTSDHQSNDTLRQFHNHMTNKNESSGSGTCSAPETTALSHSTLSQMSRGQFKQVNMMNRFALRHKARTNLDRLSLGQSG